jgi:hypothetical protein
MDTFRPAKIVKSIDEARETFELWRRDRGKRRAIPEALWDAAVSLYPKYSVHQISNALRLNHTLLKNRVHGRRVEPSISIDSPFIELGVSSHLSVCGYTIEMQDRDGAKMKVQVSGAGPDIIKLAQQFWSRA